MYAWIICMHVWECVYNVYVCVNSYICMYVGVHVWVCTCDLHVWVCYVCMLISLSLYMIAWYSDTDPFGESRTRCRRFKIVFVMDPIHWRFENWPTGRFEEPYRFVQWRPDGNSDLKPRYFMWVFALVLFSYLPLSVDICVLIVLFHVIVWYTLLVWLPVSFHVIPVSIHFDYIAYLSAYQHHFMWWLVATIDSGLVEDLIWSTD